MRQCYYIAGCATTTMSSETIPPDQSSAQTLIQVDLLSQLQVAEFQKQELEAKLNALEERFNYVLKATQDAVWDWDLLKNKAWYSDGLETLFGYASHQIDDGVTFWYDTIHPDDKERIVESIHAIIDNGGKHWQERYRFRRADGTYAWVFDRGYAIHNSDGTPIRLVGSMQDITIEMQAKEALRESEEKFRAAFDQMAVGISISSPQGKFLSVNKAYPQIFGFTEEEITQKTISDLSHPDEIEGDRKIIRDLLAGQTQSVAREKRYIHKSGKIVWGRVFGSVVRDTNNEPKYIVGVLEDITDQRIAIQALKESEERLRLVIDSAKIGVWDFDPRTESLMWDARCKEMFGLLPDDHADYEVFLHALHPDDRQAAHEANQNAINGIGNGEYDIEYRTIGLRDSKLRWVRAKGRSYRDENGVTVRYAGTVMDITEEKQRQQLLREQEERFRLLATSIPQIVWTTDENGIVEYITDKWELYTGYKPTYERVDFQQAMHPDDLKRVIPAWSNCIKDGNAFQDEYRLRNIQTGEYRWYSGTIAPLIDHNGKVIKWVGSATDIHDQKTTKINLENKVEERTRELKELNEQLEKSNAELEQYAYVTSHDLKEPLRKIRNYTDLIQSKFGSELRPEVLNYLSKAEAASLRMSGLIDDLLKYSRLSNPVDLLDVVDLNVTVQNVQEEFDHVLKDKNISVHVDQLPVLHAIPFQMHQLFFNLFSNSIKFSKRDTANRITITCSVLSEEEKIKAKLPQGDRYHKILFKDEGIGFSENYKEQIFTIFQRLNNRKDFEGHGIGLALCRKIVNRHHGFIWAYGEEGKGAQFTIILPEKNTL